jgi:FkbM family methyltransferase
MVSYAQNGEDVVLARALPLESGFYVDVGASDPDIASVTKHFYDQGWSGINIDPRSEVIELLDQKRPRDKNLRLAVGASHGSVDFFRVAEDPDLSTLDTDDRAFLEQQGYTVDIVKVEVRTLDTILAENDVERIDFLKVDVEGSELDVLSGIDLERWRPRVVVVESVRPWSSERTDGAWRGLLENHGYREGGFDGINLYFAREDDSEVLSRLAPASALDEFEPASVAALRDELGRVQDYVGHLEAELERHALHQEEVTAYVRALEAGTAGSSAQVIPVTRFKAVRPEVPAGSHPPQPAGKTRARILVVGTPHSGDEILSRLLAETLEVPELINVHPADVEWDRLPEQFVLRLAWGRSRYLERLIRDHRIVPVSVARHPFDVLLALRHRAESTEKPSKDLAEGQRGGTVAPPALPNDPLFVAWARSDQTHRLLSMTPQWWASPSTLRATYDEIVSDPENATSKALVGLGLGGSAAVEMTSPRMRTRLQSVREEAAPSLHASATWQRAFNPETVKELWETYSSVVVSLGFQGPDPQGAIPTYGTETSG